MKAIKFLAVCGVALAGQISFGADAQLLFHSPTGTARATAAGDSVGARFSSDGGYVLFSSSAGDLGAGVVGSQFNVYLRERATGSTRLVSVGLDGAAANSDSEAGGISADNRFVVFQSAASNLVANDVNGFRDIFLRDLASNSTTCVTFNANGGSDHPQISADGNWVVFESVAKNLGAPIQKNLKELYAWHRTDGAVKLLSGNASTGQNAQVDLGDSEISSDSRFVLFSASGANLATGNSTVTSRVYLYELETDSIHCVSDAVVAAGFPNASCGLGILSSNGQFVFMTVTTNAVTSLARVDLTDDSVRVVASGIDNPYPNLTRANGISASDDGGFAAYVSQGSVYRWTASSGASELVDVAGVGISDIAKISHSGNAVSFWSDKAGLTGDGSLRELFLRKFAEPAPELISKRIGAQASLETSVAPATFSTDDSLLVFESANSELVAKDSNNGIDLFSYEVASKTVSLISGSANAAATALVTPLTIAAGATTDGQKVALQSWASFSSADSNLLSDIYVFDRLLKTNILVSVGANGTTALNGSASAPFLSADGGLVLFASSAKGLAGTNDTRLGNLYQRSTAGGDLTTFVDRNASGKILPAGMSDSGQYIFYYASGPPSFAFRYDMLSNTNSRLGTASALRSPSADGERVVFGSSSAYTLKDFSTGTAITLESGLPTLSRDGRLVVIQATSAIVVTNLGTHVRNSWPIKAAATALDVSGNMIAFQARFAVAPTNLGQIGYIDSESGRTNMISRRFDNVGLGNDESEGMVVSADGRFIAFESWASDLVADDANGAKDVFLYDTTMDKLVLVSHAAGSSRSGNGNSFGPMFLGADTLLFQSSASDLAADAADETMGLYTFTLDRSLPVTFSIAMRDGTTRNLVVKGVAGTRFQVEYNSVLSSDGWTSLGAETVLDESDLTIPVEATDVQQFYRLRLIQ